MPIDIVFRELVHSRQINAFVTFPFLTTLSKLSEKSDLQAQEGYITEMVWHTFRKFIWNESTRGDYEVNISELKKLYYDQAEEDFSAILKGFLNKDFIKK